LRCNPDSDPAHLGWRGRHEVTDAAIQSLPGRIRLRLDQTLAQWGQWQCDPPLATRPAPREVLGDGISNFSVLVGNHPRFVVRLDGVDPTANGLHRQVEWRALRAASEAGLAPAPRYFNPELGSLVCDYLPPDPVQRHSPGEIGELLRRIHGLPGVHHRLDLADRIMRLENALEHRGDALPPVLAGFRERAAVLAAELRARDRRLNLCHNDLLAANRLRSGGVLWALDWEYCAAGSPWYDLAVTQCGDDLNEMETDELLRAYLGRSPQGSEGDRLGDYGRVYRYLELLWYLALGKQPDGAFLAQRTAALADAWASH
jgi:thiamine kinase-like enzyme